MAGANVEDQIAAVVADRGRGLGRPQAEAHHLRGKFGAQKPHPRIVAIQNRPVVAVLHAEQTRLGAAVLVEILVAIEMVLGEVEMYADVRLEALGALELVARDLGHHRVEFAPGRLDQRRAEIAADENAPSRGLENFADERRHRALAVGAGDRDDRRGDETAAQFQLANHRDSPAVGFGQQARRGRNAGTRDHQVDAVKPGRIFGAEMDLARRRRGAACAGFGVRVRAKIGAQIGHHQARAARRQQARGGESAYAESDHHHAFARKVH